MNNEPIHCCNTNLLSNSVIATGSPPNIKALEACLRGTQHISHKVRTMRMLGSAAIMLSWVAIGRLTAYFEAATRITLYEAIQCVLFELAFYKSDNERREIRSKQNDEQIKSAMGSFVTQYPTLFQMAVEPHFDESKFQFMLGVLDKMAGGMTQHQAAVIVGQKLVDSYVKPMIDGKKN